MKKKLHASISASVIMMALCTISIRILAQCDNVVVDKARYYFNGQINAIKKSANTIYLGGNFSQLSRVTGIAAPIDITTGVPLVDFPTFTGSSVDDIIPDGTGGWFAGGNFTQVEGEMHSNIAHINSSYQVSNLLDRFKVNGAIYGLHINGGNLYIGGNFTHAGDYLYTGAAAFNTSTEATNLSLPEINGPVNTIIPDGSGGWFIGGGFSQVGGINRYGLAQINSTGQLTNFAPEPNSSVIVLLLNGSTLYVGGSFATIGGETRQGIAAIDINTGLAIPGFDANLSAGANINSIQLLSGTLYIGGNFTTVGGQGRNYLASVNAGSGAVTTWDPNANSPITKIQVANNRLFVAGSFSTIAGGNRQYLCSFNIMDPGNVLLESWDPTPNSYPTEMYLNGNTLYLGGYFTQFSNPSVVNRNYAAAFDIVSNILTAWNPDCNSLVNAIYTIGSTVFIGGYFTRVNGSLTDNRLYLAAVNNTDGTLNSFNPYVGNYTNDFATGPSGEVFVVGNSGYMGGQPRNYVCAVNTTTGLLTSWDPQVNSHVYDIISNGSLLYLGGWFSTVGSSPAVTRNGVAAFDLPAGTLNVGFDFSGATSGYVQSIAILGSTLYLGGGFTNINGSARNYIASANASTGAITSWDPNADWIIYSIVPTATAIYAGGLFSNIGGQNRTYLASLDPSTGAASTSFFQTNSVVYEMALSGNTLYLGGGFSAIGTTMPDQTRYYGASIDLPGNTLNNFDPGASSAIYAMSINGSSAYLGGTFTQLGYLNRNFLCALDATTGELTSWNPNANSIVSALEIIGSTIYAGGSFSNVGPAPNTNTAYLAAIDQSGNVLPGFNAGINSSVLTLAASGTNLFAGGSFSGINGRDFLIQVDGSTGANTSWMNNPNSTVQTIKLASDTLLVGGYFTHLNGSPRQYLGAVSASSPNTVLPWSPVINNYPLAIEKAGSKIFVGGVFTDIGGSTRNYLAAFDLPSGNLSSWDPNLNSQVHALSFSNNRLYVGGYFTTVGGVNRPYLASIDTATGLATSWNPQPNSIVLALNTEPGVIYAGGAFNVIGTTNVGNFAELTDNCCALYYWSGTGNWNNTANWCSGLIPGNTNDAVIESGTVTVSAPASVRKLTVHNAGSVSVAGGQTLNIFGDIENQGGNISGAGTLQMGGGGARFITGNVNVANMNYGISGGYIYMYNGNLNISGVLALNTDGVFYLYGNGNIRLTGTSSSITGFNANRNIVLAGSYTDSKLTIENIGPGGRTGNVIFPVTPGGGYYAPVTINNTGTMDNFSLRMYNGVYNIYDANGIPSGNGYSENAVNITWLVDEEVAGGSNATLTLQWPQVYELTNFDRNAMSMRRYVVGVGWNNGPIGAASGSDPYTYSRTGITSFGPFTLASGAALPLNFLSFSGRKAQSNIDLSWVTDNEVNTSHFDIERSFDGLNFTSIGKVSAANQGGRHNYAFTDFQPKRGVNFYRLRQVDLDGGFMFSNTISLTMDGFGVPGIWPNPVKDELRITGMDVSAMSQLQVIDASGRMVKQFTPSPSQLYTIPELPAGIYVLKIMRKDQSSVTLRFVKQ